jgi:nucleoside-diphosphate-sugar epimerase
MAKHWFVTGSAGSLGRSIAEAVLASGDSLAATARDPTRLADLVEKYGDRVRAIALDVTDEKACQGKRCRPGRGDDPIRPPAVLSLPDAKLAPIPALVVSWGHLEGSSIQHA